MHGELQGMRVVLTRDAAGIARWKPSLEKFGIGVYEFPCISISPLPSSFEMLSSESSIMSPAWVIFTSVNGVDVFSANADSSLLTQRNIRIAAIGTQTASRLAENGIRVSFMPSQATDECLARELSIVPNDTILLVRGDRASTELVYTLERRGAKVQEIVAYHTTLIERSDESFEEILMNEGFDSILFASTSAVEAFITRISPHALEVALKTRVVGLGTTTEKSLRDAGFSTIYRASESSIEGVVEGVREVRRAMNGALPR